LAITTLVLAGIVLNKPGLDVGRPIREVPEGEVPRPDAVYARLWQDPLSAVRPQADRAASPEAIPVDRMAPLEPGATGRIVIIPVLVPGTPFSESEEQRIRMRYAVHAGLAFAGWMPLARDTLRYVMVDLDSSRSARLAVPYEWFSPEGGAETAHSQPSALVLWVDEDRLFAGNHNVVVGLAHLIAECLDRIGVPERARAIRVLGPDSSDSLLRLCADLDDLRTQRQAWLEWRSAQGLSATTAPPDAVAAAWGSWRAKMTGQRKGPRVPPAAHIEHDSRRLRAILEGTSSAPGGALALLARGLPAMTFYAARPTAPFEALEEALGRGQGKGQRKDCGWKPRAPHETAGDERYDRFECDLGAKVKIIRSAGDDAQLVADLLDELDARGVLSSWEGGDRCVIIRERETFFGRQIGDAFKRAFKDRGVGGDSISFLGYERGLDGEIPSAAPRAGAAAEVKPGASPADLTSAAGAMLGARSRERAESRSQIDYFRRAAGILDAESRVRVVVIVGTDVYDKLILLRALRPVLTRSVFLTTDLDARLLHREEAAFTRNLLVASHYDLLLSNRSPLPPFRDTYQTAVFDATLRLLDVNEPEGLAGAAERWSIQPTELQRWFLERTRAVHEVGRSSAHRLQPIRTEPETVTERSVTARSASTKEAPTAAASADQPRPSLPSLPPASAEIRWSQALLAACSIAAALAATLAAAWLAAMRKGTLSVGRMLAVRALPLAGAVAAVLPWWLAGGGTEPRALLDGVSVELTIALQLAAMICASWFIAGGRGVYSEARHPAAAWSLVWWGLVPFCLVAGLGLAAGVAHSRPYTISIADLWIVRSEPQRWAVIIAHSLAMGSVAALAGFAFACCRSAVTQVRALQQSAPAERAAVRAALDRSEALARGADRMAMQVSQVVMILLISMLPLFDRWPLRPMDWALPVAAGLLALFAAGRVTAAGTEFRSSVLARVRDRLLDNPEDPMLKAAVQLIAERGAAQQPIHRRLLLTALALPLGGLSLIQFLPLLLGRV
jgi:hypothetical protein